MDTASTLIGIALLLLFVMPAVYAIWSQSNKDKKNYKNLKEIGDKHHIKLDHFEISPNLFLGLDESSKKLLIVEPKKEMTFDLIDLKQVSKSLLSQTSHAGGPAARGKEEIARISLDLFNGKPNEKLTEIIFYDEKENSSLDSDVGFYNASKWNNLLQKHIIN